jgi:hypothetical protein
LKSASSFVEDAIAMATPGATVKREGPVKVEMDGPVFHDVPYAIWTDPPGATVYINDKVWGGQGETPYQLTLFPGRHTLWVEMDFFQPIETEIVVKPLTRDSEAQKVEFKLEREKVPVSIKVRPELAEIIFVSSDGSNKRLGAGRWKGELPAGPAKFIVQATGVGQREFEEIVRRSAIDETGTQSLVLNLRKEDVERELAGQSGEVEMSGSLIDGRVFIDGKEVGRTPGTIKRRLSPGLHRFELRREGSYPWHSELDVKAGSSSKIDLPAELIPLPEPKTNWGGGLLTTAGVLSLVGGGVFTLASVSPETLSIAGEDTDQLLSFVLYGVGATALTTGIILFAVEDDVVGASTRIFAVPIEGGWAAGVGWSLP